MKHSTTKVLGVAALLTISAAVPAAAQHAMNHGGGQMDHSKMGDMKVDDTKGGPSALDAVDGEVRRIDKAAGKVTLRHGEIKQLEMPPMTMVFEVSDKAMLDTVKAGDKVKFKVINENGKMIVTEMKPAG
jgi:Cu(I)/Ag(I) efflux system periplasmic protein CusF